MTEHYDVGIVGSGFAGTILARALQSRGLSVLLVERSRHPRFALGESSTPLAGLALERLAARYGLDDLHHLAAYGRWRTHLPRLRHGKKRGFSFFHHHPGEPYRNGPRNEARLLVAASPDDAIADNHWLRADVDAHLVQRACEEGVAYRDQTTVDALERESSGWRLRGRRQNRPWTSTVGRIVDASGPDGFLTRAIAIPSAPPSPAVDSGLLYAHLDGARPFAEAAEADGTHLSPGPFPDDHAAVHHLLEEGWMYQLPFDGGPVSVGLVLRGGPTGSPTDLWRRVLGRYPTLAAQLAGARPREALRWIPRMQHRRTVAAGTGWFLLPHAYAFVDPMFSTGMAWSLLAVERLADRLSRGPEADLPEIYDRLLAREADQIERLVAAAYAAQHDFARFASMSFLYFATVSIAETRQRLQPAPEDPWRGFLGADDEGRETLFREALDFVQRVGPDPSATAAFVAWIAERIASFDVIGLADPRRANLYPVDLDVLVARADRLGMSRDEMLESLPRLRGQPVPAGQV